MDLQLSETSTDDDEHVDSQKHVDDSSYDKDGRCIVWVYHQVANQDASEEHDYVQNKSLVTKE